MRLATRSRGCRLVPGAQVTALVEFPGRSTRRERVATTTGGTVPQAVPTWTAGVALTIQRAPARLFQVGPRGCL